MIFHANWTYIEQEFGCGLRDRFLMPVRSFDNAKSVSPFILEAGERRTGLFVHVEHGNAKAALLPPFLDQAFYRPYFTFGASASTEFAHATLADAILALSHGDRTLRLDRDLPIGVGAELARNFDVSYERGGDAGPVTLKRISTANAVELLASRRPAAGVAARQLLERSPVRDLITPYLDRPDRDRFAALDSLLSAAGVDALVLTTRLNMQEVAGIPMRAKRSPIAAFYLPGDPPSSSNQVQQMTAKPFRRFRSALKEICSKGRIACEMDDIGLVFSQSSASMSATPSQPICFSADGATTELSPIWHFILLLLGHHELLPMLHWALPNVLFTPGKPLLKWTRIGFIIRPSMRQ